LNFDLKINIYNLYTYHSYQLLLVMKASITSPEEIINAYSKHGEDFLIIDLSSMKEYSAKSVKYFDIKIKKVDGSVVIPYIKFIKLLSAGKIKPPADRDYEKLKLAIRRDDEANPNSLFGKAMELISNTFINKVRKMANAGIISNDDELDTNLPNVIMVPSCKPQTPLQKKAKDMKTGEIKTFENPMLWFGLNYKSYKPDELRELKRLDFSYRVDDKNKFTIKSFDIDIYDTENIINRKPQLAKVDDELINNYNVDKFITVRSEMSGFVYMQVKASGQSFNLNTKIIKSLYVKTNKNSGFTSHLFNDDELDEIVGDAPNNDSPVKPESVVELPKAVTKNIPTSQDDEEDDDDDSSINDEINNLKFT